MSILNHTKAYQPDYNPEPNKNGLALVPHGTWKPVRLFGLESKVPNQTPYLGQDMES